MSTLQAGWDAYPQAAQRCTALVNHTETTIDRDGLGKDGIVERIPVCAADGQFSFGRRTTVAPGGSPRFVAMTPREGSPYQAVGGCRCPMGRGHPPGAVEKSVGAAGGCRVRAVKSRTVRAARPFAFARSSGKMLLCSISSAVRPMTRPSVAAWSIGGTTRHVCCSLPLTIIDRLGSRGPVHVLDPGDHRQGRPGRSSGGRQPLPRPGHRHSFAGGARDAGSRRR